ncbi:MAG: hypothetical protein CL833_06080 [Crocinitomicaceae bacterium]|nr:hypothetical protein [Crocinitomicaceae bacterium]
MISTTQANVNFRHLFKDLVYGWSEIIYKGKPAYLKHLSVFDQVDIEEVKARFFNQAKRRGLPTNGDALERLKEEGIWTATDEAKIQEQVNYLELAETSKKQLYLKKEIDQANEEIMEARSKVARLREEKDALMGQTCEKYADSRVSDHYIVKSLYKDSQLKQTYYNQDEVDQMTRSEMNEIVKVYNSCYSVFDDTNIQKVVLQDFYQPYMPFSENVNNMFSKPLFELSINQVKLVIYSRMFKNIFENYSKIPDRIKKDPEKIMDYVNAQEKAKDNLKNMDKDGASTIVGAKKEDYDYLGIEGSQENSLSAKLKEKGGKMDMKDLMQVLKG